MGFTPYVLHRDPDYWDEREKFNPDRFINPVHDPYAYGPFGFGRRVFIGQSFALGAIQMCIAKIIRLFEVSLKPGFKIDYLRGTLVHMPKEIVISLTPR